MHFEASSLKARLLKQEGSPQAHDAVMETTKHKDALISDINRKHYKMLFTQAISRGNPNAAVQAFDEYRKHADSLSSSEAFKGATLYVATYQYDKAKQLWAGLSPVQQTSLRERFEDLPF